MSRGLTALCLLPLFAGLCFAQRLPGASLSQRAGTSFAGPATRIASWTASKVQHVYGLPDSKPKTDGVLTVDSDGLTFTSKASRYTVLWPSIIAVNDGRESVELFGTTGTIVRMMIPDGGGLAAASVMHHKVYYLTVEFHDRRGAYHAVVFSLPGSDAARVVKNYVEAVPAARDDPPAETLPEQAAAPSCPVSEHSVPGVLVAEPDWSRADVPAAYRALVYEHIIDRMQHVKGVEHVYRTGMREASGTCPRYIVTLSLVSFRPGSQVKRATMGPIGFFVGTTEMAFSARIADASGDLNATEQFRVTMRGESHSMNVADGVARKVAKFYASSIEQYEKSKPTGR